MESVLHPPLPFKFENNLVNVTSGNLCKEWDKWKKAFLIYYEACEIAKKPQKVQINILLHIIGDKCREVYDQFSEESKTVDELLKKFDEFFEPKKNLAVERHKFFTRNQQEFESIEQYVFELNVMAAKCEFKDLCSDLVRDRLICGIQETSLRERLLRESDLTLQKAIEICRLAEISRAQAGHIKQDNVEHHVHEIKTKQKIAMERQGQPSCCYRQEHEDTEDKAVHAVSANNRGRRRRGSWRGGRPGQAHAAPGHDNLPAARGNWQRSSQTNRTGGHSCSRCGSTHKRFQCPAFGQLCDRCHGRNHYSRMCRVYEIRGESTDEVNNKFNNDNEWSVTVSINNKNIMFELDTGAEVNVLPERKLPIVLVEQVKNKLKEMQDQGIIAKVEGPTDWRMLLRLQPYTFNLIYKPGRYLYIADALSRAVQAGAGGDDNTRASDLDVRAQVCAISASNPLTDTHFLQIQKCTQDDAELKELTKTIKRGWPDHKKDRLLLRCSSGFVNQDY
ncbi:uncharacterized protein LOC133527860 [Cydia pomonella]|uniref:uncharacterized protein LOC133527860 n=1 Tax=Cydia pomonella TaxID=82600 RepID=UPI002ADD4A11|nr:uncharacterized protein LOC133527860 [Cydia pomonella]